jgi:hypothetical protein
LHHIHAPETCTTGFGIQIAVLFEFLCVHIAAEQEVTVKAVWIWVCKHIAPKRDEGGVIPDVENTAARQSAKASGADRSLGVVYIIMVTVPQRITWMDATIHRDKSATLFHELTPSFFFRKDAG